MSSVVHESGTDDDSPSKVLAEDLREFHISSPLENVKVKKYDFETTVEEIDDGESSTTQETVEAPRGGKKNFKQYLPNHEFSDSKFITRIEDPGNDSSVVGDHSNVIDGSLILRSKNGSSGNGYLKKLEDWSLDDEGTVQRKIGTKNESNKENYDPPQWKHHLLLNGNIDNNNSGNNNKLSNLKAKDPESDLIVTTSFSDISGIPTNTFKNHNSNKSNRMDSGKKSLMEAPIGVRNENKILKYEFNEEIMQHDISEDFADDPAAFANNVFDNMMKKQRSMHQLPNVSGIKGTEESDENLDEGYSTDPVRAAHDVFNGIIKKNKRHSYEFQTVKSKGPRRKISNTTTTTNTSINSNFKIKSLDTEPKKKLEEFESDSSYLGDTPSLMSSPVLQRYSETNSKYEFKLNQELANKKKMTNNVPLIKPEALGLVFNQGTGVWEKPNKTFSSQDISSSRTVDNITTTNNSDITVEEQSEISEREKHKAEPLANYTGMDLSSLDDTPIDTPKINPKFLLRRNENDRTKKLDSILPSSSVNNYEGNKDSKHQSHGDITRISQVFDSSFYQNKQKLISVLTDVITLYQDKKETQWEKIDAIDLANQNLVSLVGMNELLPNLEEIDLKNNEINSLSGLPSGIIILNMSENKLSNNFISLENYQELEDIDLSSNALKFNLNFLSHNKHLKKVNLRYNGVESLNGLGNSRLISLDLRDNSIEGELDFNKIINSENIKCWESIQELRLDGNEITRICNIYRLRNLKKITLLNNPIVEFDIGKDTLPQLEEFEINKNDVLNVRCKKKIFPFPSIRKLKIGWLNLNNMIVEEKQNIPFTLEEIEIIGNTEMGNEKNDKNIEGIKEVIMSLPVGTSKLAIENINLKGKLIEHAEEKLPILQEINFNRCGITSLYELMLFLPNLSITKLTLIDNPLVSNCNRQETQEMEQIIKKACPNLQDLTLN
ncbi:hypothetical protein Kpol_538p47 [Vanderwaltozyma polyspora DSM 70294]|uniref:Uncharacterized protein n=1 Tax=Vanderwaltozyma polyspora (strain ATCC 22028 / DSM 70294 / BCRC 21397 / CBS 2163 / NBRC 10782 / NRRL Y-8283 / UCD 57-17) TaxID=436907 RepID=A7TKG0_VANPO|nr:uncharacterized protein Kpol_538p47 [Vanderwaltozyma polyspora DSM 70294]EDO17287.1 hypothetical protein Kpol_538p47 [Vanderwaltozyma polyspora DSM 70294]